MSESLVSCCLGVAPFFPRRLSLVGRGFLWLAQKVSGRYEKHHSLYESFRGDIPELDQMYAAIMAFLERFSPPSPRHHPALEGLRCPLLLGVAFELCMKGGGGGGALSPPNGFDAPTASQ
jgi:hypothetical protein